MKHIFALVLLVAVTALADAPTSQPAGEKISIADGTIEFIAPANPPWIYPEVASEKARYIDDSRVGMVQLELWKKSDTLPKDRAGNVATAIVKQLKTMRAAAGQKFVMQPTIEKDKRFDIRIRERYMLGDKVAEQLHLYLNVGPRVVMVTANSLAEDVTTTSDILTAGEQITLSAKFRRK